MCGREPHAQRTLFLRESTADGQERKQQRSCGNPLTAQGFANTAPTKQGRYKAALQENLVEMGEMRYRVVLGSTRAVEGIAREKYFNFVHVTHIPHIADRNKQSDELFGRNSRSSGVYLEIPGRSLNSWASDSSDRRSKALR